MSESIYCVYMHTSPSGKAYIGQTKDYVNRCKQHQCTKKANYFQRAVKKYGWDNFTHEILKDKLTLEQANYWESKLIESHETLYPLGYNLRVGGENKRFSDITKNRMKATANRPDVKLATAIRQKEYMNKPSEKYRVSKFMSEFQNRPEVKLNLSIKATERQAASDVKCKASAKSKAIANTEKEKKRRSETMTDTWKNKREKILKGMRKHEAIKKMSDASFEMHRLKKAAKLEKQKQMAKDWNGSKISERQSFIPMLFSFMQQDLF